jgi:hypothetical protein
MKEPKRNSPFCLHSDSSSLPHILKKAPAGRFLRGLFFKPALGATAKVVIPLKKGIHVFLTI